MAWRGAPRPVAGGCSRSQGSETRRSARGQSQHGPSGSGLSRLVFKPRRLIFLLALHQNQNLPFLLPVYVRGRNENFRASLAYHRRLGKSIQENEPVTSTLLLL